MPDRMTRPCPWCGEDEPRSASTCSHCGVALELPPLDPVGEVAGPAARVFGALVDSLVSFLFGLAIWLAAPVSNDENAWLLWVGIAAYEIVPTAIWGRTVGKLAARTRVERLDTGGVPGFASAVVRWFVPNAPLVLALSFTGVDLLSLPWVVIVFAPILGPARRGLHDRAARTRVVWA